MVVLLGSQKGGCGKTTLAANIAVYLAQQDKDVILVDADTQNSASNFIAERNNHASLKKVHCIQKYGNVKDTLHDLSQQYEYVIVDAAGRDSRELRTSMLIADIMLTPFRPSQIDLDTLPHLASMLLQAKDINPRLSAYAVLTMASPNPVVHEAQEAMLYLKEFPEFRLMNTIVRERKIYRDAMSDGKGVVELENDKAREEINNLMSEML